MTDLRAALAGLADEAPRRDLDVPRLLSATRRARRRRTLARGFVAVTVAGVAVGAVGLLVPQTQDRVTPPADDVVAPASPSPTASSSPSPTASPSSSQLRRAQVFFTAAGAGGDCDAVQGVDRLVARQAPLRPALEQLFAGPSASERAAGLTSTGVPGLLRQVRVLDGVVYVDLVADLLPGVATTSCGGSAFASTLRATVRGIVPQAPVVVALDGDPRRYVEAAQGSCATEPPPPGDPCDARGF